MFVLLVGVITLHQIYATLKRKEIRWPLRAIQLRLIETMGRVLVLPFTIIYFVSMILSAQNADMATGIYIIIAIISGSIFCSECFGIRSAIYHAINQLIAKVNHPELKVDQLSIWEVLIINYLRLGKLSTSKLLISQELERGSIASFHESISIKNLIHTKDLLFPGSSSASASSSSSSRKRTVSLIGGGSGGEVELKSFQSKDINDSHSSSFSSTNITNTYPSSSSAMTTTATVNYLHNRPLPSSSQQQQYNVDSDDEQ